MPNISRRGCVTQAAAHEDGAQTGAQTGDKVDHPQRRRAGRRQVEVAAEAGKLLVKDVIGKADFEHVDRPPGQGAARP